MANATGAFGLKPVRSLIGADFNNGIMKCFISSSYATALYVGDPVVASPTTAEQDTTGLHPAINIATEGDGNPILGVIVSFEPTRTDLTKTYSAASTEGYAYVCIDPYAVYEVRADAATTLNKNMLMCNANLSSAAGDTTTGLSGWLLDGSTPSANASNQCTVLRMLPAEDNTLATSAVFEVVINLHALRSTGDGDGSLGILAA